MVESSIIESNSNKYSRKKRRKKNLASFREIPADRRLKITKQTR